VHGSPLVCPDCDGDGHLTDAEWDELDTILTSLGLLDNHALRPSAAPIPAGPSCARCGEAALFCLHCQQPVEAYDRLTPAEQDRYHILIRQLFRPWLFD
jgi:hypothetical protein